MTREFRIAVWLVLGAVVLGIGIASATTRTAPEPRPSDKDASLVCIAERANTGAHRSGWHRSTLALVLASTPDPERIRVTLEEQLERAEENANPLALDLDGDDRSDQKRLIRELWPRVTAAQTWLVPELERHGHELVSCDAKTARYSLWRRAGDHPPLAPVQLRQRVWPIAALGVVRSSNVERLATRLRARSIEPGSTIALVAGPTARIDGLSDLGDRARRLAQRARRKGQSTPALLALLAGADDSGGVPLPLGAADLAVVPRLSALARLAEFTAEVEHVLDPGDRFVHRPEFESGSSSFPEGR
jgi:hypothetical protein